MEPDSESAPAADLIAAAAERRSRQSSGPSGAQLIHEHEQRQAFRRLIDPGIYRGNNKDVATASLKTLLTLAENLLREPDNSKYQQFKTTNEIIKRRLVEPKGALEYAIALGFRPEVQNFQPIYVWNKRHLSELRIGAEIIKEAVDLETTKQERMERAMKEAKALKEAQAEKVKLAFLDDRQRKMLLDQRERERREAREALQAAEAEAAKHQGPQEPEVDEAS